MEQSTQTQVEDAGQSQGWTSSLQGEQYTPEVKQGLSKFKTQDEVNLGYLNLEKHSSKKVSDFLATDDGAKHLESMGVLRKPGKDAKPEEVAAYKASIAKEMGAVSKVEDLKDINFTAGMPEGSKPDEQLVGALSKWAVDKHIPKEVVQQGVELWNGFQQQANQQLESQLKERMDTAHAEHVKISGSEEKAKQDTESILRAAKNNFGLDEKEFGNFQNWLVQSGLTTDTTGVGYKALRNIAGMFKEGNTQGGQGNPNHAPSNEVPGAKTGDELTYAALGWGKPKR